MIQQLLDAEGIPAHLAGAFLEGGVGELQAGSVVRVMVAPTDQERARRLITEWESREPAIEPRPASAADQTTPAFIAGLILGALIMALLSG